MEHDPQYPSMDTQIFNLRLSVVATSAYILICSLISDGHRPDWPLLEDAWVGKPGELIQAMEELEAFRVIQTLEGLEGQKRYWPNPASLWRLPGTAD
jgi:hypothetical protein